MTGRCHHRHGFLQRLFSCFWLLWLGFGIAITRLQLQLVYPTCIRMVGDGGVKTAHVFLFSSAQGIRTELNSVPVEISRPVPQVSSFVGPLSCWFRTPPSPCMQTFQWFGTELALALLELSASWNWGKACGHQTSSQN